MSLYIGKDNNGKSKLVLSRNSSSSSYLKNSNTIDNDIIFNSQIPYMNVIIKEISGFSVSSYNSYGGTSFPYSYAYTYTHTFTIDEINSFIVNGNRKYMVVFINDIQLDFPVAEYSFQNELYALFGMSTAVVTNTTITIYSSVVINNLKILAFPFTINGTILSNPFLLTNTIKIGSGDILFDDKSIFKYQYLVKGSMNENDISVNLFSNQFQIINSSQQTSSYISIIHDSNGIKIKNGNNIILSSEYTYSPLVLSGLNTQTKSFTNIYSSLNLDNNIPINWTIFNGFSFMYGKIYVIHMGVIATGIQNPSWSYTTFIVSADDVPRAVRYVPFPASGGNYIAVEVIKVSQNYIGIEIESAIDTTPNGPDLNIYFGPYNYTFTCYQVTA